MKVTSADPRAIPSRATTVEYWVIFWSQGIRPAGIPDSVPIGMESDEFLVEEATSLTEVELWAKEHAAGRRYEIHVSLRSPASAGLSTLLKEAQRAD